MKLASLPVAAVIAASALLLGQAALAHHSTAIYSDEPVELAGTVVEWQFVNPHTVIVLETIDPASGEKTVWSLEGSNTAMLFRRGWNPTTLQPGDRILVSARLLRSGAPGGNYGNVRWADGTPVERHRE